MAILRHGHKPLGPKTESVELWFGFPPVETHVTLNNGESARVNR